VFKIQVLRKISGTKRDKIKVGWIKQHREKLHDLSCSANQMVLQISWASDTNGEKEMEQRVLLRESGGKRSLGRLA